LENNGSIRNSLTGPTVSQEEEELVLRVSVVPLWEHRILKVAIVALICMSVGNQRAISES
jgi:hypothetical protein